MRNLVFVILIIIIFPVLLAGQDSEEFIALIPSGEEIGNWQVKDPAEVFSDEDLYMYINGGADLYLEYGFDKVVSCRYTNPKASRIHVEVYKMKKSEDAFGIFSINSSGKGEPVSLGTQAIRYDYYLHFWKHTYYIRCSSTMNDPGVLDTLMIFARYIDEKITAPGKKPEILKAFDLADVEFRQVKYFEGQVGLNNVFNFSHGSVAGFQQGISGKFGDKQAFVFQYSDERERREWFASLKGKMNMSHLYDNYTPKEDGFTVTDRMGTLIAFKPSGKYFYVVKGMDWNEAQLFTEQINSNLNP